MKIQKTFPSIVLSSIAATFAIPNLAIASAITLAQADTLDVNRESTSESIQDDRLAQFFPPVSTDEQFLTVIGQGLIAVPADVAEMEFIFIGYDPYYDPYAYPTIPPVEEVPTSEETPSSGADPSVETIPAPIPEPSYPPEPEPLSRADLQPVIDALVAAGIPASAIEVSLPSDGAANPYYSYYYPGSVTVSFSVSQPSRERVREIVATVEESVSGSERMYLQDRLVQYTIDTSRCDALIREAYTAALTDARDRATLLAEIIGVEIGDTPSVSDFAGYFTPTLSPCDAPSNYIYTYASPTYYDPSAPTEVQLQRGVFVSYPIE